MMDNKQISEADLQELENYISDIEKDIDELKKMVDLKNKRSRGILSIIRGDDEDDE